MNFDYIFNIVTNISVIVFAFVMYDILRFSRIKSALLQKFSLGIYFGMVGIITMSYPIFSLQGTILDGRHLILIPIILFFSPITSITTLIFILLFRFYLGGEYILASIVLVVPFIPSLIIKKYFLKKSSFIEMSTVFYSGIIGVFVSLSAFLVVFVFFNDVYILVVEFLIYMLFILPFGVVLITYLIILFNRKDHNKQMHIDMLNRTLYYDFNTGLKNKQFFIDNAQQFTYEKTVVLILCDVDNLSQYNLIDYDIGNNVLKHVADTLSSFDYVLDLLRWDAEDFMFVANFDEDSLLVENFTKYFSEIKDTVKQSFSDDINISFGYCIMKKNENVFSVIDKARDSIRAYKLLNKKSYSNQILTVLENLLDEKEIDAKNHSTNMYETSKVFGRLLNLSGNDMVTLMLLSRIHDIGKVEIDKSILNKKTPLSDKEWGEIRKHPGIGYKIVNKYTRLRRIADLILTHHEKWDGTGYPKGLKGENIPYLSRALSILDAYDVITRGRVYKEGKSVKEAMAEIKSCSGTQFDPNLVEIFLQIQDI